MQSARELNCHWAHRKVATSTRANKVCGVVVCGILYRVYISRRGASSLCCVWAGVLAFIGGLLCKESLCVHASANLRTRTDNDDELFANESEYILS